MNKKYHVPVLYKETLDLLNIKKGGVYVDATLGGGGHAAAILERLGKEGTLIGIDQDQDAIKECLERFSDNDNVLLFNENFSKIGNIIKSLKIDGVDGILADFGVSSYQLDTAERGFSFNKEARLDMRMDKKASLSAYEVVNEYSVEELTRIFKEYGEERQAYRIARAIVKKRSLFPIETTLELADLVKSVVKKTGKIHPATRIFQALRIHVNDELGNITSFLEECIEVLNKDGILACISFHSLEDRIVKQFFRSKSLKCVCPPEILRCTCNHSPELEIITRKPIISNEDELDVNVRARSAKLRGAKKL